MIFIVRKYYQIDILLHTLLALQHISRRVHKLDYCYNYCCRPEYGHHGHHGGPPGGVEDKWRHTYPYVPTSYYYNNPNPPRQNPESIGD